MRPLVALRCSFESDVISDGTQTFSLAKPIKPLFESDVISDGTQTCAGANKSKGEFESDVISDGTQTQIYSAKRTLFRH